MLRDKAGIIALLYAPAPSHSEALAEELYSTTGLRKIVVTWVQHIATTDNCARLRVNIQAKDASELRVMAIPIIEECQRTVIVKGNVMLSAEVLILR